MDATRNTAARAYPAQVPSGFPGSEAHQLLARTSSGLEPGAGAGLSGARSIACIARERAAQMGGVPAYLFLEDGETDERICTYAELDGRARAIAEAIRARVEVGARVLLLYPPGIEYVVAFFGCLYAGVIAVPAYPPRNARQLPRIRSIAADAEASLALGSSAMRSVHGELARVFPELADIAWSDTEIIGSSSASNWEATATVGSAVAMLQYTSGSTGEPKGVMITHDNLLANSAVIDAWLQHPPNTPGVTWLPPYHDMGLIGGILQPMYAGFLAIMMSPLAFAQRPMRWLSAISRYRATVSGAPNFAYNLCIRSITPEDRRELDLSSWSSAFCGAEPISSDIVRRFIDAFAGSGFRSEAFFPAYGLAEATLAVTGKPVSEGARYMSFSSEALDRGQVVPVPPDAAGGRELVACGVPLSFTTVIIVDPETLENRGEGSVGEIWVAGRCVATGYWQREEETARCFDAYTNSGDGPWMRTGDFGFLHGGQLFVVGRLKELIIIRGKKYSPVDIERTVERSDPRIRPASAVAFTIPESGEEALVIVATLSGRPSAESSAEVRTAIRRAVAEDFQLSLRDVQFVRHSAIATTSSGKVQRFACRSAYLEGTSKGDSP